MRKEQIEIAAQNSNAEALTWSHFIKGAQWADANPKQTTTEVLEPTNVSNSYAGKRTHGEVLLANKLAIAVEALRKIEAPDFAQPNTRVDDWLNAWRNTTKVMARQALEKIEGGK